MMCYMRCPAALVALLLQSSLVAGQTTNVPQVPAPSPTADSARTVNGESGCYTDYGQNPCATVWTFSRVYSITSPITYYHYVTPCQTTVTVTPSVLPPPTATFPATITVTSTVTSFTRTTSFTVETVPTLDGFFPLASAIYKPRDSFNLAQVEQPADEAADDSDRSPNAQNSLKLGLAKEGSQGNATAVVADPVLFPQRVVCERVIRVYTTTTTTYTVTGVRTTTVIAPTPILTRPMVPDQFTVTTITTSTSTWQVVMPNPTFTAYQACQANNLVSRAPGYRPIVQAVNDLRVHREKRDSRSAYDCCVSCQREDGCTGSLYHSNTCWTFKAHEDTCGEPGELRWSRRPGDPSSFVASNGKCGSWRLSNTPPTTE